MTEEENTYLELYESALEAAGYLLLDGDPLAARASVHRSRVQELRIEADRLEQKAKDVHRFRRALARVADVKGETDRVRGYYL